MSAVLSPVATPRAITQRVHWTERIGHLLLLAMGAVLGIALFAPIFMIMAKSVEDTDGNFVGLAHFAAYFETPALAQSIWNSVWVSGLVMLITVPAAFTFAYALTRSCMRFKTLLRNIALIPLLAPSLLSAISFIYWFGNQGAFKSWMGETQIYGARGIVLSLVYATFPHALMILITALSLTDARLYEAADSMGTRTLRKFFTITLPAAKYGLISAAMVVFTYAISDFGVPKVIGGSFNVMATDIFKLVIGQQDFAKGAVVGIMLLVPVFITYIVDLLVQRRQMAQLTSRSVPYSPKRARAFDAAMAAFCWLIAALMLAVLGMAVWASFVKLWPYDLSLSLNHYRMGLVEAGILDAYVNSIKMALWCATGGTVFVFVCAYLLEKTRGLDWVRPGVADVRRAADGRARARAGPGLHLLFQPPRESAQRDLSYDGDPRDFDRRALLLVQPSDCAHRVKTNRQRVRSRVGIAESAVLQDVLRGNRAGVPARDSGDQPLFLRQRDDHDFRGRLSLFARYNARGDRDSQSRRSR
jgi:iron(III) transport system permease protein